MKRLIHGFSLVEILVAVAIIAAIASLLISFLRGAQIRAYDTGALMCARSIQTTQSIVQADGNKFMLVGINTHYLNRTTDGVDQACKLDAVFIKDRSNAVNLANLYTVDVWDRRGSKVFTVTPDALQSNASDATAFSETGAGGSHLP